MISSSYVNLQVYNFIYLVKDQGDTEHQIKWTNVVSSRIFLSDLGLYSRQKVLFFRALSCNLSRRCRHTYRSGHLFSKEVPSTVHRQPYTFSLTGFNSRTSYGILSVIRLLSIVPSGPWWQESFWTSVPNENGPQTLDLLVVKGCDYILKRIYRSHQVTQIWCYTKDDL